ncbi:hypothetical protein N7449_010137 [Penicillium cf. viridicatum]|uniref:Uncharacterized protein n=1 Tax=Penicillium cf. viridicatum TaxID=2972119 RepID=A0A9W9IZF2_9EURO|nr:hypothetical protein N7449_010137 [Penicillium cf. viridicatum]
MDDVLPSSIRHYRCDIICVSDIADVASKICSPFDRPTILVNNAGIFIMPQNNTSPDSLPDMSEANHGMVVTAASLAGYTVRLNMVDYSASKAV